MMKEESIRSAYPDRTTLLSPQHWAQVANDHTPKNNGTWCATYSDYVRLLWGQEKFQRTIPLDPSTNVATLHSAPGFKNAYAFFNEVEEEEFGLPTVVSDSEDEGNDNQGEQQQEDESVAGHDSDTKTPTPDPTHGPDETMQTPEPIEFTVVDLEQSESAPNIVEPDDDEVHKATKNPQALWRYWHLKLGHLPINRMRNLATIGALPKALKDCRVPLCPSCAFGKSTRRAWRTRAPNNEISVRTITRPGDCVSVDQLESTTPGFIGQLKGILTTQRYKVMTVFVDHYSDYSYVYAQKTTSAEETIEAKRAFERFSASHGVTIRHYHADNGRFAEKRFVNEVTSSGQTITYCGVSAHFQNGVAEKRIRDLLYVGRTMLIHAYRRWAVGVSVNLWPYAVRQANNI